jgi:ABC-type transport system involved in multi-copper enzyme maturation permease subunit
MFSLLVEKELKNLMLSPKFAATFAACTVLILVSILAGIIEYKAGKVQYEAAIALVDQELADATSWGQVSARQRIYREPNPMQIFVSGIHFDIGRFSVVSSWQDIKLRQSAYSIEPLFAVFRFIDFVFIVQVVLSLLTIVFAYDLVSGEKESGTLRLMLANPVPRAQYIIAKVAGAWLGLMVPLLIPLALGVLLILLFRIPMVGADWVNLGALAGLSVLYLTAFLCLGTLFSALTHRSGTSFLLLLVLWIAMVLVIPRGGMMVAAQMHPVASVSELESRKEGFARDRRRAYFDEIFTANRQRLQATEGMTPDERDKFTEEKEWDWMVENDERQKRMEADIAEYNRQVDEEAGNRQAAQQRLGFSLSRISPASAYQLAAMTLGGTDLGLKQRFLHALQDYRTTFNTYTDEKNPGRGSFTMGSVRQAAEPLELSDMPRFEAPARTALLDAVLVDAAILLIFSVVAFGLSVASFNRYDVL